MLLIKWTRLVTGNDMAFLLRSVDQVQVQSVEVSDVAKAEENKSVKFKRQSHVDHVLQ